MNLLINGVAVQCRAEETVAGLLKSKDLHPGRVVVEVNMKIVKREYFDTHTLYEGDIVEILRFVGGG